MNLAQLIASRSLWRAREVYRQRKHRFYHSRSKRPVAERNRLATKWHKLWEEAREIRQRRDRQIAELRSWGGARAVTNEIVGIVNGRYRITSRKRDETYGNPDSDHHISQKHADAVDFATANNYALGREIAQKMGGSWSGDYDSFIVRRNGRNFRVQLIAGTHGTGPHFHAGARRV